MKLKPWFKSLPGDVFFAQKKKQQYLVTEDTQKHTHKRNHCGSQQTREKNRSPNTDIKDIINEK
jgi:hypothetical protein